MDQMAIPPARVVLADSGRDPEAHPSERAGVVFCVAADLPVLYDIPWDAAV